MLGLRQESGVSAQSDAGRRIEKTEGAVIPLTVLAVGFKRWRSIKTCEEGVWRN